MDEHQMLRGLYAFALDELVKLLREPRMGLLDINRTVLRPDSKLVEIKTVIRTLGNNVISHGIPHTAYIFCYVLETGKMPTSK